MDSFLSRSLSLFLSSRKEEDREEGDENKSRTVAGLLTPCFVWYTFSYIYKGRTREREREREREKGRKREQFTELRNSQRKSTFSNIGEFIHANK